MDKKSFINLAVCYVIWGAAALYWNLFPAFDPIFKVCCRVVFSALTGLWYIFVTGKRRELISAFLDRKRIKYIVLAAISIGANWLVYVWSLTSGHVVDASLGNYLNPIAISVLSIVIFKNKADVLQIVALGVALAGAIINTIAYGSVPYVAILVVITFTSYTIFKKLAKTSGLIGSTAETMILAPLALLYMLIFGRTDAGFGAIDSVWTALLVVSTGAYTIIPFILYGTGLNKLPTLVVGLMGLFTPTVVMLTGILFFKESISGPSLVNVICVLIAIAFLIISLIRAAKKEKAAEN